MPKRSSPSDTELAIVRLFDSRKNGKQILFAGATVGSTFAYRFGPPPGGSDQSASFLWNAAKN